jgi:hypothetical protein
MSNRHPPNNPAGKTVRDLRIDAAGFVQELEKHFAKGLKVEIKAGLVAKGASAGEANCFLATLTPTTKSWIDADAFLRLLEKKIITRDAFVAAITVGIEAAGKLMSEADLAKIVIRSAAEPRMSIERKPGVELKTVDVINALSGIIAGR